MSGSTSTPSVKVTTILYSTASMSFKAALGNCQKYVALTNAKHGIRQRLWSLNSGTPQV